MGKLSRTKGHNWERTVAKRLSAAARTSVKRELREPQQGNLGDLASDLPLTIQCKVGANPSPWRAVREAEQAAEGTGRYAVAVIRCNRGTNRPKQDIVCMPLTDFEAILTELRTGGVW